MSDDASAIAPEVMEALNALRDITITVTLDDDTEPPFWPAHVTPAQGQALRQQSRGAWRAPTLLAAIFEEDSDGNVGTLIGPEEIAGIVFLARRQSGDKRTYSQAMDDVAKADIKKVAFPEAEDDDEGAIDSPPPSGGPSGI